MCSNGETLLNNIMHLEPSYERFHSTEEALSWRQRHTLPRMDFLFGLAIQPEAAISCSNALRP
jgi:hypothetical protein